MSTDDTASPLSAWPPPTASRCVHWAKSTYSGNASGGECVQARWLTEGRMAIRDSQIPTQQPLVVPASGWSIFLFGLRNDEFT